MKKKPIERDIWKINPRQLKARMKKEGYTPMNKSEKIACKEHFDSVISKVLR